MSTVLYRCYATENLKASDHLGLRKLMNVAMSYLEWEGGDLQGDLPGGTLRCGSGVGYR